MSYTSHSYCILQVMDVDWDTPMEVPSPPPATRSPAPEATPRTQQKQFQYHRPALPSPACVVAPTPAAQALSPAHLALSALAPSRVPSMAPAHQSSLTNTAYQLLGRRFVGAILNNPTINLNLNW